MRDFTWTASDDPHASRRRNILQRHSDVRELFGVEPLTFPIVIALVAIQLLLASQAYRMSSTVFWVVAWSVGAPVSHALLLAFHEFCHNLCFVEDWKNRAASIFANSVTVVPAAISFRRYHLDHHLFLAQDGLDPDMASAVEARAFCSQPAKVLWLLLMPMFYALRPLLTKPKAPTVWEGFNALWVLGCDACILYCFGLEALQFLCASTFIGMSLHPVAGHFIAEHMEFFRGVETASYYGVLNRVNFNVGFHTEHHDLPRVPWSRLPRVKQLAPEFYSMLPHHDSYLKLFWLFVTDRNMGPAARLKRARRVG